MLVVSRNNISRNESGEALMERTQDALGTGFSRSFHYPRSVDSNRILADATSKLKIHRG
jgi:hypothetical protein